MSALRRILHLLGAVCLFGLGADSLTLDSVPQLALALAAMAIALGWAATSWLLLAAPGGWVSAHRKQLALLLGSIAVATTLGLFVSTRVRMGPSAAFRREHFIPNSVAQPQQSDLAARAAGR